MAVNFADPVHCVEFFVFVVMRHIFSTQNGQPCSTIKTFC